MVFVTETLVAAFQTMVIFVLTMVKGSQPRFSRFPTTVEMSKTLVAITNTTVFDFEKVVCVLN